MADRVIDPSRAPVAFGRLAAPQLFAELQRAGEGRGLAALTSLCDLLHDPELIYQTATGGFLEQLTVMLEDKDASVRTKTCELLHIVTGHNVGRQALVSSSLFPPLSQLLDDSSPSCRTNVHRVLNRLSLLPAGAHELLSLVPKLMLKLQEKEEEEEVQVLLLSTLTSCSRLDPVPALASGGVSVLGHKLSHRSPNIRREAAAAMMALSVCQDGKRQVCEGAVLPVLAGLLQDEDVEVQANAAGVLMYTAILTRGKHQCLHLDLVPVLLDVVSQNQQEDEEQRRKRKALVVYALRALTSLAEVPNGRRLLMERLPLLERRTQADEEDQEIRRAAQTAVRVITWTP